MSEVDSAAVERRPLRAYPGVAWTLIVLLAAFIAFRQAGRAEHGRRRGGRRLERAVAEMQGKYLLGAAELPMVDRTRLLEQIDALDAGSPLARLRFIVLVGELEGPNAALRRLTDYDESLIADRDELSADERALENILRRLYRDLAAARLDAPALRGRDRRMLAKRLGWHGRLALLPADGPDRPAREALVASARRTMYAVVASVAVLLMAALIGMVGLVTFAALFLSGRLQRPLAAPTAHGGIYAETFAVWLLLFVCLSWLPGFLAAARWVRPPRHGELLTQGSAMLLSLAAVAWPVLRGVPWGQVRREIGWSFGRRPLVEVLLGGATYLAALPLVFLGLVAVFVLLQIEHALPGTGGADALDPTRLPSHPIVEWVIRGGRWGRLQVVLLASVIAPLVEETMFRGVLYRHLRDATGGKMSLGLSVLLSAAAVSFVFAAIHPQGWVAIPALMSLAFAFSLAREWRGSLVASIVAHGVNNGVVTLLLVLLTS